jgi:hypothetical protein
MFRERLMGRGDPMLYEPALVRPNAKPTCDLLHVEADLLHGWPPRRALTASATTWWWPAASSRPPTEVQAELMAPLRMERGEISARK